GPALPAIAALLGPGQVEALAQEIEQGDARIVERHVAPRAVDTEADGQSHCDTPIGAMVELKRGRMDAARHARAAGLGGSNLSDVDSARARVRPRNSGGSRAPGRLHGRGPGMYIRRDPPFCKSRLTRRPEREDDETEMSNRTAETIRKPRADALRNR